MKTSVFAYEDYDSVLIQLKVLKVIIKNNINKSYLQ
jgi:hypothetical protein